MRRQDKNLSSEVLMLSHFVIKYCTEVRFASFLSSGFTTMAVINQPERKLTECTYVYTVVLQEGMSCLFLPKRLLGTLGYANKKLTHIGRRVENETSAVFARVFWVRSR